MDTFRSDLSGNLFPISERVSGNSLRKTVFSLIREDYPHFTADNYMALSELNYYREKYISASFKKEIGELNELEQTVLQSMTDNTTLTDKIDGDEHVKLTIGQRVADKVASFGGSWKFIILFSIFILSWIALNILLLVNKGFDPYPFILLNLILSCVASMQAPVIMMSQNRQEEKDRDRAKKDYMINLKSELELRLLHEKIDHQIMHQYEELVEILKLQVEMLNDLFKQLDDLKNNQIR